MVVREIIFSEGSNTRAESCRMNTVKYVKGYHERIPGRRKSRCKMLLKKVIVNE